MTVAAHRAARSRGWRQDPAGRRARILAAATRAFARRGYRATRMADVARAAKVAEGTVFHLFGSKQGLLRAVGERYGAGLAQAAFGGVGDDALPADVEAIVRRMFRFVRESEAELAPFLLASGPEEGGPAQDANRAAMLAAIEVRLRAWRRRGLVRIGDPRITAEIQFGLVESALRDCFLRGGGRGEAAYVREVTRCLAGTLGLAPKSSA